MKVYTGTIKGRITEAEFVPGFVVLTVRAKGGLNDTIQLIVRDDESLRLSAHSTIEITYSIETPEADDR